MVPQTLAEALVDVNANLRLYSENGDRFSEIAAQASRLHESVMTLADIYGVPRAPAIPLPAAPPRTEAFEAALRALSGAPALPSPPPAAPPQSPAADPTVVLADDLAERMNSDGFTTVPALAAEYRPRLESLGLVRHDSTPKTALRRLQEFLKKHVYGVRIADTDLRPSIRSGRATGGQRH